MKYLVSFVCFLLLGSLTFAWDPAAPEAGINKTTGEKLHYPADELRLHVVDIHFYSGNLSKQYIAHHYCTEIADGFTQCLLTDHNDKDSKFIGTEFILSKELFEALPEEEKPLWHSHFYEVKSGLFVAPDLTEDEEWNVLKKLITTYGKVVDVFHQGLDMPLGPPLLANALALDQQVDWDLADIMDKELKLNTTWKQRREKRKALEDPVIAKGADSYLQTGQAAQFKTYFIQLVDNSQILDKNKNGTPTKDEIIPTREL